MYVWPMVINSVQTTLPTFYSIKKALIITMEPSDHERTIKVNAMVSFIGLDFEVM